jgi:transcriptional regulator with XRE-family HTH domain
MIMNIGKKIADIRKSKNFSQKEVALTVGIDRAQYSRIENDKANPTLLTLEKIAKTLDVNIKDFFNDEENYDINSYDKCVRQEKV